VNQFKLRSLKVRKGGLPPLAFNPKSERGQATLPDLEIIGIDFSSFQYFSLRTLAGWSAGKS
jgi:hypothetical protein